MFTVSTPGLRTFALHCDALASSSEPDGAADSYATDHLALEVVDTLLLFATMRGCTSEVLAGVQHMLSQQATALSASATEVRATADDYDATDEATSARLDAAYPGSASLRSPVNPWGRSVYVSAPDAQTALVAPDDQGPSDLVATILTTDWFSPTALVA